MTGEHAYHIELNKMFRTQYKEALSVFGGPHPTYTPGMIHDEYVDAICGSEGKIYFPLLMKNGTNQSIFKIILKNQRQRPTFKNLRKTCNIQMLALWVKYFTN